MKLALIAPRKAATTGYTLVEALVASSLLMMAISAASTLTLTLLTQEEMSQRHGVALAQAETIASLYQQGLDETAIRTVVPNTAVVEAFTLSPGTASVTGVGDLPFADIAVRFNPSPASDSWVGHLWTSGRNTDSRTIDVRAYRLMAP